MCKLPRSSEAARFHASSLPTLIEMVIGGRGLTLLPEMAADALRGRAGLVTVPLSGDEPPGRSVGLAWRAGSSRGDQFRELGREMATLHMAAEPPGSA